MKKEIKLKKQKPPECLWCHKPMKPAYDKIAKKATGHLWHCQCYPNSIISVG